jgi:hypothetical protein
MDFTIYSPARRRHPIWFGYVEPVLSMAAVGLMLAGLFLLEAVAVSLTLFAIAYVVLLSF